MAYREWQNLNETNLPVELYLYFLNNNNFKAHLLKTYLGLKLYYPIVFHPTNNFYSDLASKLNVCSKSIRSHIGVLNDLNLIGIDDVNGTIYVRSKYNVITTNVEKDKFFNSSSYHIKVSKKDLLHFTEFIVSAAVAYLIKKNWNYEYYKASLLNDGEKQALYKNRNEPRPVANSAIANFLGKSISWVHKYKHKACKIGLITLTKAPLVPTGVSWSNRNAFIRSKDIPKGQLREKGDEIFLVAADMLTSTVYIKEREKK